MATKFGFITQPNSTSQGYTIQGGWTTDYTILGVSIPQTSSSLIASPGILVGCLNADGTLDTTATTATTIAIGTNPNTGTLSGTLTKNAVAGIVSFTDLAINGTSLVAGTGYTLSVSGALTGATSNAFNVVNLARINPTMLVGSPGAGTGFTAARAVGPYRYRPGRSVQGVSIFVKSTAAGDAAQIVCIDPGTTVAASDITLNAYAPFLTGAAIPLATQNVPYAITLDATDLRGACDIYVFPTTQTGTITVTFKRVDNAGGQ